jgi:hypothetical protein
LSKSNAERQREYRQRAAAALRNTTTALKEGIGKHHPRSLRQTWDAATDQERQELLQNIGATTAPTSVSPPTPADDDHDAVQDEFLCLINNHYRAGVMKIAAIIGSSEPTEAAIEKALDKHVSWLSVLELAEEDGMKVAIDAVQNAANQEFTSRLPEPTTDPEREPEPQQQPTKRRVARNRR